MKIKRDIKQNLGTFKVATDRIKAVMMVKRVNGYPYDCFFVLTEFYTFEDTFEGEMKSSSVKVELDSLFFPWIFEKLKMAEGGIEELLKDERGSSYVWREHREVMNCIISLEDKTKEIPEDFTKKDVKAS